MSAPSGVLALVPARGGSWSIPRKNVRPFAGHPLLAWSVAAARGAADVVADASERQRRAVDAVRAALGAVAAVTQSAAATAKESAAAADELSTQATRLAGTVADFELPSDARVPGRTAARVVGVPRLS